MIMRLDTNLQWTLLPNLLPPVPANLGAAWGKCLQDTLADREYQRLQTQPIETQRIQDEPLAAKEALFKRLERQSKLQQAVTELKVAKLVSSMITIDSGSATPMP